MGICDSSNDPTQKQFNSYNNNPDLAIQRDPKYFNQNSQNKNSLILNNDVIVSDSNENIEATYQKLKLLGKGSFGEVWLVQHKILGKQFAMKIIEKNPLIDVDLIINEINILKQLDHPNILKILEFHLTEDKFYIITDYLPEGELYDEIDKKSIFSEREASYIIYQVLSAIRYCHKMRVVHRDIKPENIMIMGRENGLLHVKLIDFGTAKLFNERYKNKALVGSSYYIAPEVIKGKYDEACDLWSIGVIMYILLTGSPPFNGENEDEILKSVLIGKYDTNLDTYKTLSNNAKDLITKLLRFNPSERITAKEALMHPWFKTAEFTNSYRINSINSASAQAMIKNLENYKSNNIIKCAVLAYLVHQNINIRECINASKLFTEIDLNKDGKLEKNELEYAITKYYGINNNQAKLKVDTIFKNIDTDDNGYIESEEFIRACINPQIFTSNNYLRFAFNYFDNDKDGTISIQEIENKFYQNLKNQNDENRRKLRVMFDQIDINKDGFISFEEFSNMIKGIIST